MHKSTPESEKIDTLCMYLKHIHDATINQPIKMSLTAIAKKYGICTPVDTVTTILKAGLLKKFNHGSKGKAYQWNTTEPNRSMAKAIRDETAKTRASYRPPKYRSCILKRPSIAEPTIAPSITTADIKSALNKLKTGLIELGFSESKTRDIIINEFL